MQSSNQTKMTNLNKEAKNYNYTNYPKHLEKYSITPSLRNTIRQIKQQSLTANTKNFDTPTIRSSHISNISASRFFPGIIKMEPQKNIFTINENISLSKLYNISFDNALYLFHSLLYQLITTQQKIGHSYFNVDDWCISMDGILMRKEIEVSDEQDKKIEETIVVDLIIQYIKKNSWGKVFDDFYLFFKRAQVKSKCDFKYTLSLVQLYCKCSKITIKKSFDFPPKQKDEQGLGSPKKTISSIYNSKFSNQRANTVEDEYSTQFPTSQIESKSQEKYLCPRMSVKNIKKSAQITKKHGIKEYLKRMTHSNQIKNDYWKTCNKSVNDTCLQKQSSASTSNKTVNLTSLAKKNCVSSLTLIPNNKNEGIKNRDKIFLQFQSNKEIPCSLQADLQSVESKSQQNEENQLQKQFCRKAYQNNQWKRTFNNLLDSEKQIAQSFIDGKDEVIDRRGQPQNLGKLARVVVQSFLNAQNNSRYIIE